MAKTRCRKHEWVPAGAGGRCRCIHCPARSTYRKLDQLARMRETQRSIRIAR